MEDFIFYENIQYNQVSLNKFYKHLYTICKVNHLNLLAEAACVADEDLVGQLDVMHVCFDLGGEACCVFFGVEDLLFLITLKSELLLL